MLRGIKSIISPELLHVLASMGHGDELVLGDGNFPAATLGRRVVRADGHGVPPLLEAILQLFPLDTFVAQPAALMEVLPGSGDPPLIWETYEKILREAHPPHAGAGFEMVERFAFYERASQAFAVVATGETALYANIILKKGVITD
ncbi:L-fucose mutarotase [Alkalispirochaeta americana]|uniref:L-fucose mutarotase n=1 Tax=Alkalispirochaeta americana TaxID=159291 RepID=A0A1N6QX52_9SPIO|nr:RbsD/FucU domain-containing protein [Alkalispirochaeta americana]SIQ21148.1 L-fucose mutarotase [Alkalispirochaeta americana]